MRSFKKALGAVLIASTAIVGCTGILGSFEVSNAGPGGADGDTPGEGSATDTSVPTDGPGADADAGKPLVCKGAETKCVTENVCAVLATDMENCGACGHSCGGGACEMGVCKPFMLYDATPLLVGPVAKGQGLNFFFATSDSVGGTDNRLWSCLAAKGCAGAPRQLVVRQYSINAIASVNASTVTFISAPTQNTERPAIYACNPGGCPAAPVSFASDGLNGIEPRLQANGNNLFFNLGFAGPSFSTCAPAPGGSCTAGTALGMGMTKGTHGFAIDTTDIYFVDSPARGSTIAKCSQADTACVPTAVVSGDNSAVENVAVEGGKLYWILPGRADFHEGKLMSCDLPCTAPKLVANGLDTDPASTPQQELYADSSGTYWFTKTNILQRCLPGGCTGGPRDFAGSATMPLNTPHSLTADTSFIYWAEKTQVWRLAKP